MNAKRDLLRTFVALALAGVGLAGCGGGDDEDELVDTQLRLVNATSTIASTDLFRGDDLISTNVGRNTGGDYGSVDDGSATFKVSVSGQSVALASTTTSLEDKTAYTALAWGRGGAVNLTMLTDDESEPSSGNAKLRVFNAAPDAGTLDVFLTDTDVDPADSSPVDQVEGGDLGAWSQLGARSYRLRVTAAGDPTDVRLDIADFPVDSKERVTLVLQPGDSGVLVHGLKLVQRGAVTAYANTSARLRLVASVASQGRVGLALGGVTLVPSLSSPSIGTYLTVAAGAQTPTLTVGGTAIAATASTFTAGTDYSLMVYGSAAAPIVTLITDDNRLPTTDSRAKLRLVNGLVAQASLDMTLDAVTVAGGVAPGGASAPVQVLANAEALLEVFGDGSSPLFTTAANPISIVAGGVYTFFYLDGATAAADRLRRDR